MIQTKEKEWKDSFQKIIKDMKQTKQPFLYSFTEKLQKVADPLTVFANSKKYVGNRFYWTDPDQLSLVGIGAVYIVQENEDSYKKVELDWKKVLENAKVDNPYNIPGTGPILMGGFSFDPEEKSIRWDSFQNNRMVLPKFLITNVNGESYLTVNVQVDDEFNSFQVEAEYEAFKLTIQDSYALSNISKQVKQESILVDQWKDTIKKATDSIKVGDLSKVVLARELEVTFDHDIVLPKVIENLQEQQQQSYIFAMESGETCFIGATPERLVKVQHEELLSACLAGTAPRGNTVNDDEKIGNDLLNDEKNLEEHAFVVQMIKQSVEGYCEQVEVPTHPVLYKLKNLQHLFTPVKGILNPSYSILDVVEQLHPTPAMGGVPREKALKFIREEEQMERGWYAAPIGWIDQNFNGEFAVAIRSGLIKGKKAYLYAGCGIVKESDPEAEFLETEMKFKPMLHALGGLQ